jgi:hypothetical protein
MGETADQVKTLVRSLRSETLASSAALDGESQLALRTKHCRTPPGDPLGKDDVRAESAKRKCNKCKCIKSLDEFSPSAPKRREYVCVSCKEMLHRMMQVKNPIGKARAVLLKRERKRRPGCKAADISESQLIDMYENVYRRRSCIFPFDPLPVHEVVFERADMSIPFGVSNCIIMSRDEFDRKQHTVGHVTVRQSILESSDRCVGTASTPPQSALVTTPMVPEPLPHVQNEAHEIATFLGHPKNLLHRLRGILQVVNEKDAEMAVIAEYSGPFWKSTPLIKHNQFVGEPLPVLGKRPMRAEQVKRERVAKRVALSRDPVEYGGFTTRTAMLRVGSEFLHETLVQLSSGSTLPPSWKEWLAEEQNARELAQAGMSVLGAYSKVLQRIYNIELSMAIKLQLNDCEEGRQSFLRLLRPYIPDLGPLDGAAVY